MKLLGMFLSLLTLVTLSLDLFDPNDSASTVKKIDKTITFEIPKKLSKELLATEVKWKNLLSDKDDKVPQEDITLALQNALVVGDKNYELLGIFNDEQTFFVLLKNELNEMIKLALGEKLPGEFTLIEINNNTIVFDNNTDRVEYKLFENDNNAKN
jgi:hypothetical protein